MNSSDYRLREFRIMTNDGYSNILQKEGTLSY